MILPAGLKETLRALSERTLLRPKRILEFLTPTNASEI